MKKMFTGIKNWMRDLLKDGDGAPSSKRIMGLLSGISLCVALFLNVILGKPVDSTLVNAVAALAFGTLGLTSVEKVWSSKKSDDKKEGTPPQE